MSNILSYNNKTHKTGNDDWIAVEPYTDDDIKLIRDPNGGLSEHPRTAIPSPFAQLDLVKNAFLHLANDRLAGAAMDERLVSDALDVAQLFFEFENHKHRLHIVRWNRREEITRLKASPQQRLYGETLELFMDADDGYNFSLVDEWNILMLNNMVLGGTSPSSLVMAAPTQQPVTEIQLEQGVAMFSSVRHLWQRDDDFVYCLFLLMNAYLNLRTHVSNVYAYMMKNLPFIQRNKPELYRRIIEALPNPAALETGREAQVRQMLDFAFEPFDGDEQVTILGARLYRKRTVQIRASAAESDFLIAPERDTAGETLPLVLRSAFNGSVYNYRYIDKEWDPATVVLAAAVPIERRRLPDTAIEYPFVTTDDFFTDTLICLNGTINDEYYFNGNLRRRSDGNHSYLLPLKPLYFKYFNAASLMGQVDGRPAFELEEMPDGTVTATLRIPVRKRAIELVRTYAPTADASWQFDEMRGTGRLVRNVIVSAAIFPFVRTESRDVYSVQLFSMPTDGCTEVALQCYRDGMTLDGLRTAEHARSRGAYATTYYDVDGSFDFMQATIKAGGSVTTGIIVPRWREYMPSARELVFAVDFGTTNSHVEWAERGHESEPLTFDTTGTAPALVAPMIKKESLLLADQLQRIEFVPSVIDQIYGFPLRSALARNKQNAGGYSLFGDVNVPFLYERQYFAGYDVATSLKWLGDSTPATEFLRELVLLIRAKVLVEGADLNRARIVYFYPVSMGGADRSRLARTWQDLYNAYIGGDAEEHLHAYPESIAPAFFYKGAEVAGSSYVSIDIGGGTSDIVIYQPTPDGNKTLPVAISSFRFAGNAIFGDGFNERDADNNPLLAHYTEYFRRLVESNRDITHLNSILRDIMQGKRSEDINAFLFSIENVEQLRGLNAVDRNRYSYNALLRNDDQRKIIFLYFYGAIIYYIASAMKHRGYAMPKQIYFSGTGSKILNIIGSTDDVSEFTQMVLERVSGERMTERFDIKIERDCPKQITCRGGVRLENARLDSGVNPETAELIAMLRPRSVGEMKYNFSMTGDTQLTLSRVNDLAWRGELVEQVRRYNAFFLELCSDAFVKDEFGIEPAVIELFRRVADDNLPNYLVAGINAFLQGRYEDNAVIEDVPFFYPIIGVIRYNLIGQVNKM